MVNTGFTRAAKKYLKPGKYARRLIPARSTSSRLNKKERRVLNKIGNKYGCHTCGRRHPGTKSGNWIADHQPVSKLRKKGQQQRLYPYCQTCSRNKENILVLF